MVKCGGIYLWSICMNYAVNNVVDIIYFIHSVSLDGISLDAFMYMYLNEQCLTLYSIGYF